MNIKRLLALLLMCSLLLSSCLSGCATSSHNNEPIISDTQQNSLDENVQGTNNVALETHTLEKEDELTEADAEESEDLDAPEISLSEVEDESSTLNDFSFDGLADPDLLIYVEDSIYTGLIDQFDSENYVIENIDTVYISKEYIEEVAYNSQANIWFGYTLEELDQQFQGTPYVFTLDEHLETNIKAFEPYDDTYEKVLRNVAIGTGVILICVTVTVISGGVGAVPVSMVFAASAKTATVMALSSGLIGAFIAGTITAIQTGDINQALEAAALQGSENFMWGAIIGALSGGISELLALRHAGNAASNAENVSLIGSESQPWRQAELRALEKYGGQEQISYLNGEVVPFNTPGATRPDIIRHVGDHIEAIEVKYYDLENQASLRVLFRELEREVADRVAKLPIGSTQRIVLDVTNRGFTQELVSEVVQTIETNLAIIYPNIPVDVLGLII